MLIKLIHVCHAVYRLILFILIYMYKIITLIIVSYVEHNCSSIYSIPCMAPVIV